MGRLTTHVLDTASGKPAGTMTLWLQLINQDGTRSLVTKAMTNRDGRTDQPLMEGATFKAGTYELSFSVSEYFAGTNLPVADPPFLDVVTLRFTIAKTDEHYHVPLLVSPWAYSTYRGS